MTASCWGHLRTHAGIGDPRSSTCIRPNAFTLKFPHQARSWFNAILLKGVAITGFFGAKENVCVGVLALGSLHDKGG